MYCDQCHQTIPDESQFCPLCGATVGFAFSGSALQGGEPVAGYAGFWRRFFAMLLDSALFCLALLVLLFAMFMIAELFGAGENEMVVGLITLLTVVISTVGMWLYFALSEHSTHQATPGKRALGIVVTDMEGRPISFGRATGRYFGKYISQIFFSAGFLMAAFTAKKQALHDIMASCLVVKRQR